MRVNVMVGGPQHLIPLAEVHARQDEKWVGVDIGATRLLDEGITPTVAVGDFDSTSNHQFKRVKEAVEDIQLFPPEKDYTDTQLGVKRAIELYQPDKITVFGATGGRLDQYLSNLFLPLEEEFKSYLTRIQFVDQQNIVDYYLPGEYEIKAKTGFKYLAFVNLTPVSGLTLVDEKYPLNDWHSAIPFCWSSNEFNGELNRFSFQSGVIAVIKSRDLKTR